MRAALIVISIFFSLVVNAQMPSIIPTPSEYDVPEGATFEIDNTTRIVVHNKELKLIADNLCATLLTSTGIDCYQAPKKSKKTIELIIDPTISESESAYWINIQPYRVLLVGVSEAAVYYALQSLYQLMPPEAFANKRPKELAIQLPFIAITDEPENEQRTLYFDSIDSKNLNALIPIAALYKINRIELSNNCSIPTADIAQLKKQAIQYYIVLTTENDNGFTHDANAQHVDDVITITNNGIIVSERLLQASEKLWTPQSLQQQYHTIDFFDKHRKYLQHLSLNLAPTE